MLKITTQQTITIDGEDVKTLHYICEMARQRLSGIIERDYEPVNNRAMLAMMSAIWGSERP